MNIINSHFSQHKDQSNITFKVNLVNNESELLIESLEALLTNLNTSFKQKSIDDQVYLQIYNNSLNNLTTAIKNFKQSNSKQQLLVNLSSINDALANFAHLNELEILNAI